MALKILCTQNIKNNLSGPRICTDFFDYIVERLFMWKKKLWAKLLNIRK